MIISSPEFEDGGEIPEKYGYTKNNVNPSLRIEDVPDKAETLVLIVDDPDAVEPAGQIWDHWVMFNIAPDIGEIGEGEAPGTEGENSYGENGYGGPNPPDRPHTYVFRVYALDQELRVGEGDSRAEVEAAMRDHVIEKPLWMVLILRSSTKIDLTTQEHLLFMTEETLFESEQKMSKTEIAEYLKKIADKLESDQEISLKTGSQSIRVKPGANPEFEIKVERESSSSGEETSLEFEIEWKDGDSDTLEVD